MSNVGLPKPSIGSPTRKKGGTKLIRQAYACGVISRRLYYIGNSILGGFASVAEQVSNWVSLFHKRDQLQSTSFDLAFTMLEPETPETILSLVESVDSAAKRACNAIDEQDPHEEVKYALQDLRQAIQSFKSDTVTYKVLIATMKNDINPYGPSTFAIFISTYVRSARVTHLHSQYTVHNLQTRWTRGNAKLQRSARGCAALA